MSWFDRIFGDAEDFEGDEIAPEVAKGRHLSRDMLAEMSADDLRQAFFSLSTGVERMMTTGRELMNEMEDRQVEVPSDATLVQAMQAVEKSADGDQLAEKDEDEDNTPTLKDRAEQLVEKHEGIVPGSGEATSGVAFVGATPSRIDQIRKRGLCGPPGSVFNEVYLKEMDLDRDDVLVTHLVPRLKTDEDGNEVPPSEEDVEKWSDYLDYELEKNNISYVVALGNTAKEALGDRADEFVPHPEAVRKHGDSGEVARKLERLTEKMQEQRVEKSYDARVVKADEERQEITGVVMEPNEVDTDGDWAEKDDIHEAMVFYMENSQQTKIQHRHKTEDVVVVETWQARDDFRLGEEMVKAGSWLATVKVYDDEIWKAAKSGQLNGFSIGAMARFVESDE